MVLEFFHVLFNRTVPPWSQPVTSFDPQPRSYCNYSLRRFSHGTNGQQKKNKNTEVREVSSPDKHMFTLNNSPNLPPIFWGWVTFLGINCSFIKVTGSTLCPERLQEIFTHDLECFFMAFSAVLQGKRGLVHFHFSAALWSSHINSAL